MRFTKSFSPLVWMDGKFHYHTERNKKTFNGALRVAKSLAEGLASYYTQQNIAYDKYIVTIKEIK